MEGCRQSTMQTMIMKPDVYLKSFALALKARTLLYAASPLNNPDAETNPAKWIETAKAAKKIIDAAGSWNLSLVSFDRLLGADNYKEPEMILIKKNW